MTPAATAPAAAGPTSLARGGGLVAPALTLLNAVGYVVAVASSHALAPAAYGELTALLGVLLVASVPALALQAVVARSVARRPVGERPGPRERALLRRCGVVGLVVAGLLAALSPVLADFLHTGPAGPLWLAAGLAPLAVLSAVLGVLQGREQFPLLALLIGVQGLTKLLALVPLLLGGGPQGVLLGYSAGTAVAAGAGLLLLHAGPPGPAPALPSARELALAGGALLALLALASLDLLLARHALPRAESGRYAVGSVLSKAAFWLPQAVAVVVFPRLADPASGRALLRRAVLAVTGLGLLELVGCALLSGPVLRLTFGAQYGSLRAVAPLFVLQGAALAVVQLLVYRGIALRSGRTGRLVAVALVVEPLVVLALRPTTVLPVVLTAAAVAVGLAAAGLLADRGEQPATAPAAPPGSGPATSGRP